MTKEEIKINSGLNQKNYASSVKALGINFHSLKSLVNKGKGNLIADFMLVPAHGNEFVYPYNPIYNYTNHCYQNCLVIMFICFESEDKIYPVLFDYWISEIYYDEDESYLTKDDVFIRSLKYLTDSGLDIETILFDAGFFHKEIIQKLSDLKIDIVTRCPKGRKVTVNNCSEKVKELFVDDFNGSFYYYHRYQSFLNSTVAEIYGEKGQIVGIAKQRNNLIEKKLFYLFSTNLKLTAPQILQLYKRRWKIESFFKVLKSYLSLSVFYRNDYEYVNERINIALAGFFIIQELASKIKSTFHKTLKLFQEDKLQNLFEGTFKTCSKYFCYYV